MVVEGMLLEVDNCRVVEDRKTSHMQEQEQLGKPGSHLAENLL